LAVIPVILLNGTTADANDVMDDFNEIYTNILSINIGAGGATGTGLFVLQDNPTINGNVAGTVDFTGPVSFTGGITGNVAFDTDTFFIDATTNRIGIRTITPDAPGHFFLGAGGGAATNIRTAVKLENSSEVYLEFETPNTNQAGFLFSDNSASVGQLLYDHNINQFTLNQTASIIRNVAVGSAAINADTLLKIENNNNAYLEFTTLTTNQAGIIFTDTSGSFGQFLFSHNTDRFTVNRDFEFLADAIFSGDIDIALTNGIFTDGGSYNQLTSPTDQSTSLLVKSSGASALNIFTATTTGPATGNVTWGVDISQRFQGNLRPELDNTYQFGNSIAGGDLSDLRWSTVNCMEIITATGVPWDMGGFTGAADAVSNGYVDVTVNGVAYRLMTRA